MESIAELLSLLLHAYAQLVYGKFRVHVPAMIDFSRVLYFASENGSQIQKTIQLDHYLCIACEEAEHFHVPP